MPTYLYRCRKNQHEFELFHSIKDETPKRCPICRSRADRVPAGGAGLLFKGSGFYITDYRSQSYRDKAKQEKGSGGGGDSGGGSGGTSAGGESGGAKKTGEGKSKRKGGGGGAPSSKD